MAAPRFDLPLARDPSARLLPWLIGVMVFLAVLLLAAALLLTDVAHSWDRGLSAAVTVQIPPAPEDVAAADERLTHAVELLRATPGVARVRPIPTAEVAAILEPWLGSGASAVELPLPQLIDVTLADADQVDLDTLGRRLAAAVPGAVLDTHALWREKLLRLVNSLELVALGAIVLILAAAVLVVVFATRSSLAVHREVIEVLHLIGAQDSYIAKQFQRHAFRLGLQGGLGGVLLGAAVLATLGSISQDLKLGLLPDLMLGPMQWLTLAVIPLAIALIAMLTARRTVLRALDKML